MAEFLLIHGAWHGGWCWEKVVPLLEAQGHKVVAPDLPGMGADHTPFAGDVIGQWTDALAALVEAQSHPMVVVGHSRAGLLVSALSERLPDRVKLAVYLAAVLVPDGKSLADVDVGTPALKAAIRSDESTGQLTLDLDRAMPVFYADVARDVTARAVARLCGEPAHAFDTRLHLTAARYGRVPRAYIETADDRAIPLEKQRLMQAWTPCEQVVTLRTGHSAFYAKPERLAEVLDGLALGTA